MDAQERINKLWNGAASDYDATPRHGISDPREVAAWQDALRRLLPPAPADVLDVGTGTGVMALLIAGMGYRVRGVDLAESMLARAKASARERDLDVVFERGDAIEPPGEPESADVVISRHLLWTITDPPRALANWRRLIRPGGRLVIIDGLWAAATDDERLGDLAKALPITQGMTLDGIRGLVQEAGFAGATFSHLANVERIELELHGPSEDDDKPRYVLTATKPRAP